MLAPKAFVMYAEFEEKTYEQHLTSELVHSRRLFFPPGQVLEDIVGFDVALRTSNPHFWNLFTHMYPWWRRMLRMCPPGTYLKGEWWEELEHEIECFPRFKFNCFIQAKRPNRMVRSDAAEYASWNKPYFRYNTFPNQQQALESLAQRTSGKAIVVYACPAFHTYSDLWEAIYSSNLVKESNFCEVEKLKGHFRYSFISSGNYGIAHSEPTPIESRPFKQALEALQDQEPHQSNLSFITNTSEEIDSAAEQLGPLRKTYVAFTAMIFKKANSKLAKALAKIYAFRFVCNVQILIGY